MSGFIQSQLQSVPGPKKNNGSSTFILCPYHSEKTPSARVFHDNGYLRCYGCGVAKPYKVWSKEYGLEKLGKHNLPASGKVPTGRFLTNLLSESASNSTDHAASVDDLEFHELDSELARQVGVSRTWRSFRSKWLSEKIGAKLVCDSNSGRHYVWLPVSVRGRLRGHVLAQLRKPKDKMVPSYLNAKGQWSKRYGLFPMDTAVEIMRERGLRTIVVVEGPRDALRLIHMNIPAVSMLGTHSWTDLKSRMLELCGVERVVLLLDGDDAGKKATRFLRTGKRTPDAEPVMKPLVDQFQVKVVRLWNLEVPEGSENPDPGNLDEDFLLKLINPLLK